MGGDLKFTIEQERLKMVAKALRHEADGKQLRKELLASIKAALEPLRDEVRNSILSMESAGLPHEGEPLRQAIANKVIVQVRTGGRATGAGLKAGRKGMPRGFEHAPRRLNAKKFRHPVFQRTTKKGVFIDVWVNQIGKPRWFDDPIRDRRKEFVGKVEDVVKAMAQRIARGH